MAQDILSDLLNQIMNAKRAGKTSLIVSRYSKLALQILEFMKQYGYIEVEEMEGKIKIILKDINACKAIKPRYTVQNKKIENYTPRFLPARDFGYIIISTSQGLMNHKDAQEKKIGGSLIAYFY